MTLWLHLALPAWWHYLISSSLHHRMWHGVTCGWCHGLVFARVTDVAVHPSIKSTHHPHRLSMTWLLLKPLFALAIVLRDGLYKVAIRIEVWLILILISASGSGIGQKRGIRGVIALMDWRGTPRPTNQITPLIQNNQLKPSHPSCESTQKLNLFMSKTKLGIWNSGSELRNPVLVLVLRSLPAHNRKQHKTKFFP